MHSCHSIVLYPYYAWPARPASSALGVGEDTGEHNPHLKYWCLFTWLSCNRYRITAWCVGVYLYGHLWSEKCDDVITRRILPVLKVIDKPNG